MENDFERARARFLDGVGHFEAGRFEPALGCFEAALALAPGRASVLSNLGVTLVRLGRWREAADVLRRATGADPSDGGAWAAQGLASEATGDWARAIECLERALALGAGDAAQLRALGRCRQRTGALPGALEAFGRALAADPDDAEAWSEHGSALRELGRFDEAAASFGNALSRGADPELNRYYLASVGAGEQPPAPPRRYVEGLFDEYAAEFSEHLVRGLRYRAHESLVRPLLRGARRYRRALDLGCGTGLCGDLLRAACDEVIGVDVSSAMLAHATRSGAYRELVHADIAHYLADAQGTFDLVLAADVFIYVGDLSEVFRSIRRVLEPGGCLAFSVELAGGDKDLELLPSLRYGHSPAYVERLARASGLAVRERFSAPIREELGHPVDGLYLYLS